jgi:hypothetical protein
VRIDTDTVWVRSRDIKRFNATVLAKVVLRFVTAEGVQRQRFLALGEFKSTLGNQQVLIVADVAN